MSIASEISRLQGAKADLKTAIEGKGVTVSSATKLDGYADLVDAIQQGGGGSTLITKNISANGTYNASSDSADGYSQVTVAVPASAVDSGTKNITANGNNQDVVGYAAVNVNVPNTYSAADEGKVVSNGALVAQTAHADVTPTTSDQTIDTTTNNSLKVKGDANLVASNIKKDVEIFGTTGSYEGGGGGVDLTDVAVPVSQNTIGGMFQAMIDGHWDSLELTVTSGTNPIEIDFGRTIKGFICYPKSITVLDGLAANEANAFALCVLNEPDAVGAQTYSYNVVRGKANGGSQTYIFNRMNSYTMTNGLLSLVPAFPGNANFHPFGFGNPYIFVYWW